MKAKRLIGLAFGYAVAAMAGGVFYREFTKFNGFEGATALGLVHTHLFVLGMLFFVVAALCERSFALSEDRRFGAFCWVYNVGLIVSALMLVVRGVPQVLGMTLTSGVSAAISGVAGIGHAMLGVGVVLFFLMLRKKA